MRGQLFQQGGALVVVEHFRAADQGLGLGGDGRGHRRVGMPQVGRALPADAVDIFFAVRVPQAGALPAHNRHLALGVHAGFMRIFNSLDRFCNRHFAPRKTLPRSTVGEQD